MNPNTPDLESKLAQQSTLRSRLGALLGAGVMALAVGCQEPAKAKADEPKTHAKQKSNESPRVGVGISLRGRPYLKVRPPRHHEEHNDHKKERHETPKPAPSAREQVKQCLVKGNIGSNGKKIYHISGCADYAKTVITLSKGEKCFDSEAAAKKAGWKKANNCK